MNTLFNLEPIFPEGFHYFPHFISVEEEIDLYNEILKHELNNFNFQGYTANRKVAGFGYDYSFHNHTISKGKAIPAAFNNLIGKVSDKLSVAAHEFVELLITEYPIGSVINWHRDAPPFGIIAGISLMSDCTFRLRPQDKAKQALSSVISFSVKRGSLYTMQGPARNEWQHSISAVKQVRYSITLRTIKSQVRSI